MENESGQINSSLEFLGYGPQASDAEISPSAATSSSAAAELCSNCRTVLNHGGNFCYSCGTRRSADEQHSGQASAYEPYPTPPTDPSRPDRQHGSDPADTEALHAPVPDFDASAFMNIPRPPAENTAEEPKKAAPSNGRMVLRGLLTVILGVAVAMLWTFRHETTAGWQQLKSRWDAEFGQFMYGRKSPKKAGGQPAAATTANTPRPQKRVVNPPAERASAAYARAPKPETALAVRVSGQAEPRMKPAAAEVAQYPASSDIAVSIASSAEGDSPGASGIRFQISPRESLYLLLKQVSPAYPPAARVARVQGAVVLKALIGKDGLVHKLDTVSGDPLLAPAAIEAVRQWQYRPYYRDGEPCEVETMIVLEFSLAESRAANYMP